MRQDTHRHSLTTSSDDKTRRQKEVKLASQRGGGLFGSEVLRGCVCVHSRCSRAPRVVIGWEDSVEQGGPCT